MFKLDQVTIRKDPYQHFVVDNSLDIDFFHSLQEEIRRLFDRSAEYIKTDPSPRYEKSSPAGLMSQIAGAGYSDGLAIEAILSISKKGGSLKKFLHYLTLQETQEKLYRLLVPITLKNPLSLRPLKIHPPDSKVSLLEFLIFRNCYLSVKLSAYESNAGLFQHIDHSHKVIALLLFLGHSDDVVRKSGGTQVYEIAKGEHNWSDNNPPTLNYFEETKLILKKDVSPIPNRLFGFRPSKISWHGVEPDILPKGVKRECLQINLMKSYNFSSSIVQRLFDLKAKIRFRARIKKIKKLFYA